MKTISNLEDIYTKFDELLDDLNDLGDTPSVCDNCFCGEDLTYINTLGINLCPDCLRRLKGEL